MSASLSTSQTDVGGRRRNQAEECARFKVECASDTEHISGLDWCEVDYEDYVPKGSIYPSQPECFALETLLNGKDN